MERKIKIAPSFLSADFSKAGEEIKSLELCGADIVHLDVMDGHFVNNITFGPKFVKDLKQYTTLPFDVHLMIEQPWKYIERFADAGSDIITVHYGATKERLRDTLKAIKSLGKKCGAVINPDIPFEAIKDVVEDCDMILLMSVFPGFGGQKFIETVIPKIKQAREYIDALGKDIDLEVDGGVTRENVGIIKSAGANVIVAGSTVYKEQDKREVIEFLRRA